MIFDLPRRSCSACEHWNINYPQNVDGHVEADCREPKEVRDQKLKRASDYCSRWDRK